MEELVFTSPKGNPVTNSLLVAEKFGKDHKHVLDAVRNLAAENSAARFFHKANYDNRGKKYPMYLMNRDGFSLLIMGFTGTDALKFKIDYINAFNAMETRLKELSQQPITKLQALEMALEAEKKVLALQPKADFADRVIDTENMVDIGQAAKLLKLPFGRNIFFSKLREDGIFFKSRNEPRQEYINKYFELREKLIETNNHGNFSVTKILVNQKGLFWLSKRYGGELNTNFPQLNGI